MPFMKPFHLPLWPRWTHMVWWKAQFFHEWQEKVNQTFSRGECKLKVAGKVWALLNKRKMQYHARVFAIAIKNNVTEQIWNIEIVRNKFQYTYLADRLCSCELSNLLSALDYTPSLNKLIYSLIYMLALCYSFIALILSRKRSKLVAWPHH